MTGTGTATGSRHDHGRGQQYPEDQRPVAVAGEDMQVAAGTPIWFDASQSYDPDGRILSYRWDFADGSGALESRVQHTFWEAGTYPVSLTVQDDTQSPSDYAADTLIVVVTPAENRSPVSDFPEVVEAFAGETATFDASGASDRDGSIIAFEWDLGDGNSAEMPVVNHVYKEAGIYTASLSLIDNGVLEPETLKRDFVVKVVDRPNQAPVARFSVAALAVTQEIIEFDASASVDPDGSILSYHWDFGDGQTGTGIKTEHAYQYSGNYAATLRIVDNGRPEDRKDATVTASVVIDDKLNTAPLADAGDDITISSGEVVSFNAGRSRDPDGLINAYLWSFGDGSTSRQINPRHAFHDPGEYRVTLQVTDNGKAARSSEDVVIVKVLAAPAQELVQ